MRGLLLLIAAICACESRTLKRCANLFDDSCTNGGLVGSVDDESWLSGGSTPGKRSSCKVQVMGECLDYLLESNDNQDGSVGKRSSCKVQVMGECLDYLLESNDNQDGSVGKRSSCKVQVMSECLDYMLEGNANQEGSVGKRSSCKVQVMGECLDYLLETNTNQDGSTGKRGIEAALDDGKEAFEKRCANLFDDSCTNGGLVGSVDDENWLAEGSPGKRSLFKFGTQGYQKDGVQSRNKALQYILRGMYY